MLFGKGADKVLQMAKQMHCKVWIDVDDNIWHVPFSNLSFEHHMDRSRQLHILQQADLITVSTRPLYTLMENFLISTTKPILLLENYLWIEDSAEPRTDGKKVIAWRGGDHTEDFLHIIQELYKLEDIADEIHYFGDRPQGYTPTGRSTVLWHPYTDTWNYMKLLRQVNPIIIFGYWADIPFNTCKSDVMWQEATRSGGILVINEGWDAFKRKPVYMYDGRNALAHCVETGLNEWVHMKDAHRDSEELMADKRKRRGDQSHEVSRTLNSTVYSEQLLGGGVSDFHKATNEHFLSSLTDEERYQENSVEHPYKGSTSDSDTLPKLKSSGDQHGTQ